MLQVLWHQSSNGWLQNFEKKYWMENSMEEDQWGDHDSDRKTTSGRDSSLLLNVRGWRRLAGDRELLKSSGPVAGCGATEEEWRKKRRRRRRGRWRWWWWSIIWHHTGNIYIKRATYISNCNTHIKRATCISNGIGLLSWRQPLRLPVPYIRASIGCVSEWLNHLYNSIIDKHQYMHFFTFKTALV